MAIPNKNTPIVAIELVGQFPDPPDVPDEVIERFPSMRDWQTQFQSWWQTVHEKMERDAAALQDQINKLSAP